MAVQQNRKSRSKTGMGRAHHALKPQALSEDPLTGELHLRHHITPDGYYRGRKVIDVKSKIAQDVEAPPEE